MRGAIHRKLDALSPGDRVALYGKAAVAWRSSQEQRAMGYGATVAQAAQQVREAHEASLRHGYAAEVRAERAAFLDRHVAAALA